MFRIAIERSLRPELVKEGLDRTAERGPEEPAYKAGLNDQQTQEIWKRVLDLFASGQHPAVSIAVRRGGHLILNGRVGFSSGAQILPALGDYIFGRTSDFPAFQPAGDPVAITEENPICVFSASKAVTATVVHIMAERGAFKLTDKVVDYIPEYGTAGKAATTIEHVLNHTAGIPRYPEDMPKETIFYFDEIVSILSAKAPDYHPGSTPAYHATTGGYILAEILRRTTGKDLNQLLDELIRKPMGMKFFTYGLPEELRPLRAHNYPTGLPTLNAKFMRRGIGATGEEVVELAEDPRFLTSIVPSANLHTTAEEMSRFYQMLLAGGISNGKRIMSEETIRTMIEPTDSHRIDRSIFVPMRFSRGFMLGHSIFGMFGPNAGEAFGHLGFMNNLCWADPQRDIAVSLLSTGKPVLGPHWPAYFRVLNAINNNCPVMRTNRFGLPAGLSA